MVGCILMVFFAKEGFTMALRCACAFGPAAMFCSLIVLCCVAPSLSMAIILTGVFSTCRHKVHEGRRERPGFVCGFRARVSRRRRCKLLLLQVTWSRKKSSPKLCGNFSTLNSHVDFEPERAQDRPTPCWTDTGAHVCVCKLSLEVVGATSG